MEEVRDVARTLNYRERALTLAGSEVTIEILRP